MRAVQFTFLSVLLSKVSRSLRLASERFDVVTNRAASTSPFFPDFARDRHSDDEGYRRLAKLSGDATTGAWQNDFKFASNMPSNANQTMHEILAGKTIFIAGDSWGREKYKTLVRLLAHESNVRLPKRYLLGHVGQTMRHTSSGVNPHLPQCWFGECPGVNLELCGRPGGDTWVSYGKTPEDSITIHYRFKPYFDTRESDGLLAVEIAHKNPDVVMLDIGRWGATPNKCQIGLANSSVDQVGAFFYAISSATKKPVIVWQSGEENGLNWEDDSIQDIMRHERFLPMRASKILNRHVVNTFDCAADPRGTGVQNEINKGFLLVDYLFTCPNHHGNSGVLLDEVIRLGVQYLSHVLKG